jgi:hypothetical protein
MEYLIRVTRTTEFETVVDADDPLAAADMAKLEATGNSVIVDEKADICRPEGSFSDRLQTIIEREYQAEQELAEERRRQTEAEDALPWFNTTQ